MKTVILTAAALVLTTSATLAAPARKHFGDQHGGVTGYERVAIAHSAATLAALKRRAWFDGRLSFVERFQIKIAERRHFALVARARHS